MCSDPRIFLPLCDNLVPVIIEYQNQWFKVLNRGGCYTVEKKALDVMVLPVVDETNVVLIRPYRPVIADTPFELPAGSLAEGETPRQGAQRELYEETGIKLDSAGRLQHLPPLSTSPNRNPLLLSIFQVDLSIAEFRSRVEPDSEIAKVELLPLQEVMTLLLEGKIYVSSAVAVLARFLLSKDQEHLT